MARKDQILTSFLSHPLLKDKYELHNPLPETVREALLSTIPIVKSIAIIIENLEVQSPVTDGTLKAIVNQYLNTAAQ
jgi:hypothetical protein